MSAVSSSAVLVDADASELTSAKIIAKKPSFAHEPEERLLFQKRTSNLSTTQNKVHSKHNPGVTVSKISLFTFVDYDLSRSKKIMHKN